jgi:LDH2 family malate/lactate/ureidoglycolate dehydrogenase
MTTTPFDVDRLREFVETLFLSAGISENDSHVVTDAFIEANLRGVDTHGVRLVPAYIRRVRNGAVNATPRIRHLSDLGATVRLDGDNGFGQVVGVYAMRLAMERAGKYGIGMTVAGNTSHIGAASYYTRIALSHKMAGIATSNNLPSMFVWGGLKRALSNPPLSIAFPSRTTPFVLDICLGTVAWNKIYMRMQKGEPIPSNWAWNANGELTTDPSEASQGGSIVPIGNHKGSSLALAVDLFTGVLGGFAFADQIGALLSNDEDPEHSSHLMIAFDVTRMLGPELLDRTEQLIAWCKDSPPAQGFDGVLMPGEPEERMREQRLSAGISLASEDIDELRRVAADQAVPWPFE